MTNFPHPPDAVAPRAVRRERHLLAAVALGVVDIALALVARGSPWGAFAPLAPLVAALMGLWWGRRAWPVAAALAVVHFAIEGEATPIGFAAHLTRGAAWALLAGYVGAWADRSRRTLASLEILRDNLQALFESSPVGLVMFREGRALYANARFERLLGLAPGGAVGRIVFDFVHPDDRARVEERVRALRDAGELSTLPFECRLRDAGGETVFVEIHSSAIDFERRRAVLVHVYDVTARVSAERRQRETQEAARRQEDQLVHSTRLAELGEMAASVAHEINQPLTSIRNFAKNAIYMLDHDAGGPGDVRENLRLVSEQVDRASKIIRQMRELARRTEMTHEPVDLNAVARDALDFLMPQFRVQETDVTFEPDAAMPPVIGDRIRLEQVFINLLSNARQALDGVEHRRLRVTTRRTDGPDPRAEVEVADSGVGFAPEAAARLFAPFFTTKAPGQGTGLGLSISRQIVEDHGGTIDARGETGRGATFTIRLPLARRP
ncbi:MAG: PAS domain S-box protein [Deltaproteobacteria bacterium]|nr:PAS domain S-box protein [Deltaproteobacteria bacterium]